jgi:hypothetical protein
MRRFAQPTPDLRRAQWRDGSGPATRADHCIDTGAGVGAWTLFCDDQVPRMGIERSDRTLDSAQGSLLLTATEARD